MPELSIFARITPLPEHRDAALSALRSLLSPTRAEPGCLRFELNLGCDDDPSLYLIERWSDDAALDRHYAQPYTARVFAAYEDWLAEPMHVVKLRPQG